MQIDTSRQGVVAVLGPTNTGKTHLAMERMLGHASGMIGFPLRLLARENYDRAVAKKGLDQVALVTGEEKIIPERARYFLCTVEAMPLERPVEFLAVDEIQMCADPDRGHKFTDRLLRARGLSETMFLGAETIRPLLERLVPDVQIETRPRMSTLRYAGHKKVTRLPPRSAVVAFSANEVYGLAELVRRQRGGAAVVLGALSPRTRNAQVGMYQAGEVDYLVATDAIGMGLNMDLDHVAFAGLTKFDGRIVRHLNPAELSQTAGRAGRAMNDGTFGTTASAPLLDEDVIEAIEVHEFAELRQLSWRNPKLDYGSLRGLKQSLERPAPEQGLVRARPADDEIALQTLIRDEAVQKAAADPDRIELLWTVCQIPDFQKIMPDSHARLLTTIYTHLTGPKGRLPEDWLADNVKRQDKTDGDIDALTQRIAHIRTWTYVAFHADWVADANHWRERTRTIEDKLSDALHDRLTQRFVDKSTAVLMSRIKETPDLLAAVSHSGDVTVEGHLVGHLKGFRFEALDAPASQAGRTVTSAAARALKGEISRRVGLLTAAPDEAFKIAAYDGPKAGTLTWDGEEVARLTKGSGILTPLVRVKAFDLLDVEQKDRIAKRLDAWVQGEIARRFQALEKLQAAPLEGLARGLAFQLSETLGIARRDTLEMQLDNLDGAGRKPLKQLGVYIGRDSLYLHDMLKPGPTQLRLLLWGLHQELRAIPAAPEPGRVNMPADPVWPKGYDQVVGFRRFHDTALRIDICERIARLAWTKAKKGPFEVDAELMNLAGCGEEQTAAVLRGLGFKGKIVDEKLVFRPNYRLAQKGALKDGKDAPKSSGKPKKKGRAKQPRKAAPPAVVENDDSPFAVLKKLTGT